MPFIITCNGVIEDTPKFEKSIEEKEDFSCYMGYSRRNDPLQVCFGGEKSRIL